MCMPTASSPKPKALAVPWSAPSGTAEVSVTQRELQYLALFKTHPIPAWVYDAETLRFLAVKSAAVQLYGFSREEFLAMTITDIRPEEDVPALLEFSAAAPNERQDAGVWRH